MTRVVPGLFPRGGGFIMTLTLVLLPEALATLVFLGVGAMTRNIGR
jgi:hypothetical protein